MATNFNKYYYDLDISLVNRTDNEILNLNDNLLQVKVSFNYTKNVFPITQVFLSLDSEQYETIRTKDVMIKLSIRKKALNGLTEIENINYSSPYLNNELFVIIDKDKLEHIAEAQQDDIPSINVKLTLFSMNHLKINKVNFNGNYYKCRLIEVMSLISNINQTKLYIESPINQKIYEQVLVPPMNCIGMMDYLQKNYHIYNDGLRMFFDFNEYYILNGKISNSTPTDNGEYRNVMFDVIYDSDTKKLLPFDCGYQSETSDYYYIKTDNDNIQIIDSISTKEEIFGTNNIILSIDENLNINRDDIILDNKNIDKTKVYYNLLNSPYSSDSFKKVFKKNAIFKFRNLDIETFKCNKLFMCRLNDEDYRFNIRNVEFVFHKDKNTGSCIMQGLCNFIEN